MGRGGGGPVDGGSTGHGSMGRTRKDARRCAPFVVHGGKALTRELLSRCPSLQREYELPKWCTNTRAQTLIGSQILVDDGMLFYRCVKQITAVITFGISI